MSRARAAEPYQVHAVSAVPRLTFEQRLAALQVASFDVESLHQREVTTDLVIDSGMSALSEAQLAAMVRYPHAAGDGEPFQRLQAVVQRLTGQQHVLPLAKGRAAEQVLFLALLDRPALGQPKMVIGNSFFDTTRETVSQLGGSHLELGTAGVTTLTASPTAGDLDLALLDEALTRHQGNTACVLMTLTTVAGGHPVSIENLRAVRQRCQAAGLPLVLDACRFAENAGLLKHRLPALRDRDISGLVRETLSLADVVYFSAAKDGLSPTGGVLATNDEALFTTCVHAAHNRYGYRYTGGLPAMMLAVMAEGISESTNDALCAFRVAQLEQFASWLTEAGATPWAPTGGHAVFLEAPSLATNLGPERFPAHAFLGALYLVAGVRAGFFYRGRGARAWLEALRGPAVETQAALAAIRLCVPRRRLTTQQLGAVAEAVGVTRALMRHHPGGRQRGLGPSGQPLLELDQPAPFIEAARRVAW